MIVDSVSTQVDCADAFRAPMSFGQQRLWMLDRMAPGSATYNVRSAVRLRGELDLAALRGALDAIVARHEILRTTFALRDGEPVQIVGDPFHVALPELDLESADPAVRERETRAAVARFAADGFDLERGPLVRALLVRLDEREHVLALVMHHIVTDDWSRDVFQRELSAHYDARRAGREADLPELGIQYADFAAWQRATLQGDELDRLLGYWRERLAGVPARVELPVDRLPSAESAGEARGGVASLALPAEEVEPLLAIGRAQGATPFMTLLAVFAALLHRYGGQDDFAIGLPIANRTRAELEPLVGFFVNMLALRAQVRPEGDFRALLSGVRDRALGAYEHQDLPFERLVEELHPERGADRTPIVNVVFHHGARRDRTLRFAGLDLEAYPLGALPAKYDLALRTAETAEGLLCTLQYRADLFDEATAETMLRRLRTLIRAIVRTPDRAVSALPLLEDAERAALLAAAAGPPSPAGIDRTLCAVLAERTAHDPDAVALVDDRERLTYGELDDRAGRLATELRALGVGRGAVVGVSLDRSVETVVALLAILRAGGAYLPLDPEFPIERLTYAVADAQAPVIVTQSRYAERFAGSARLALLDVDRARVARHAPLAPDPEAGGDDLAYVLYTSGSTGRPKGVAVTHRSLLNFLGSMAREPGLDARDVLLAVTTLSFDIAGLELWLPLTVGARVVIAPRAATVDGKRLAALLARSGATVLQATPSTWRLLLGAGWEGTPGLRMLCGGEALPPDLAAELIPRGAALWNMYGPTETTIWSAISRVRLGEPISLGAPIAGTRLYVREPGGDLAPPGVAGELCIGGAGLARGYLGRPELTAERFVADPFSAEPGARMYRTGDLVRRRADGGLAYLGRGDAQIKLRGYRIDLGEIESELVRHAAGAEAAVAVRGEAEHARLVAYLAGDADANLEDLRAALGVRLPTYMLPTALVRLERLPLTPNGKLDRAALPAPPPPAAIERDGPLKNPLHYELVGIWEPLLGASGIDVEENFFDLGGHSLLAAKLMVEIEHAFGKRISFPAFLERPTIAHLARLLVADLAAETAPLLALRESGTRAPFFFLHGDFNGGGYYPRRMLPYLDAEQPLYVFHAHGTTARPFPPTIEAIAADCVAMLRERRPHGPYVLGGFCIGGLVAYETARILRAAGEEVLDVILVDSAGGNATLTALAERCERLARVGEDDERRIAIRARIARVARRLRRTRRHWRRLRGSAATQYPALASLFARKLGRRVAPATPALDVEGRWRAIAARYVPGRYEGALTALVARPDGRLPSTLRLGWHRVASRVEMRPIRGEHLTCVTTYVDVTATQVAQALDVAEGRRSA